MVEAEERLKETPALVGTPRGCVQQSPWLSIANKQLELMRRYMVELGLTPAARSRVMADSPIRTQYPAPPEPIQIQRYIVRPGPNGQPPTRELCDAGLVKHGG